MKTYNVHEAAEYCHCHPGTIREYIRSGRLIASKVGRAYCIRQIRLDEFLQSLENDAVQASLHHQWSEQKCQKSKEAIRDSIKETVFGTLTSAQVVKELDALLVQRKRQKHKPTAYN